MDRSSANAHGHRVPPSRQRHPHDVHREARRPRSRSPAGGELGGHAIAKKRRRGAAPRRDVSKSARVHGALLLERKAHALRCAVPFFSSNISAVSWSPARPRIPFSPERHAGRHPKISGRGRKEWSVDSQAGQGGPVASSPLHLTSGRMHIPSRAREQYCEQ